MHIEFELRDTSVPYEYIQLFWQLWALLQLSVLVLGVQWVGVTQLDAPT